ISSASDADNGGGNRRRQRTCQCIRGDIRGPGVFEAVLRTAILKPIPNETLGVISNAEQLVVLNPPIHFTQVHILVKVDWRVKDNQLLSVRYNAQRFVGNGFENGGPQNSLEHTGASDVTTDTLTGSLTSTISSSIVSVARAGY